MDFLPPDVNSLTIQKCGVAKMFYVAKYILCDVSRMALLSHFPATCLLSAR
jgi:hypothetical protein